MPFTHLTNPPRVTISVCEALGVRSWLKWGLPLAVVVLLAAAGGGIVLAQTIYRDSSTTKQQQSTTSARGITFRPDAAAHPDRERVELVLGNHFNSINERNYTVWKDTVVPAKSKEQPRDEWLEDYSSTHNNDVVVHRIDRGPDNSLLVMVTFKSTQDLEHAPPQIKETCVIWNVVYPMVTTDTGLRIDTTKSPNRPLYSRCGQ